MRRIVHIIEDSAKDAYSIFEDGYEHGYYKAMREFKGYSDGYTPAKQEYKM